MNSCPNTCVKVMGNMWSVKHECLQKLWKISESMVVYQISKMCIRVCFFTLCYIR